MNVLIISRIIPSYEIASNKTTYYAIDKTLRLATPDSGMPHLTLSGDFCLKLGKLALEVGLLSRDLIAQSFKSLLPNICFFSRGSPALDRVFHGQVSQEKPLVASHPAGINTQGVNDVVFLLSTR